MKYSKLDAALAQLDTAIELFLREDYLQALTLGGAAEEILGALTKHKGETNAIEFMLADYKTNEAIAPHIRELPAKTVLQALNHPRNSAKHAHDPDEAVEVDASIALQMLMRAVPMARDLGAKSSRMLDLHKWIVAHPEVTGG
jgi:hypothetical protein